MEKSQCIGRRHFRALIYNPSAPRTEQIMLSVNVKTCCQITYLKSCKYGKCECIVKMLTGFLQPALLVVVITLLSLGL